MTTVRPVRADQITYNPDQPTRIRRGQHTVTLTAPPVHIRTAEWTNLRVRYDDPDRHETIWGEDNSTLLLVIIDDPDDGIDESAAARIRALPDVSITMTLEVDDPDEGEA